MERQVRPHTGPYTTDSQADSAGSNPVTRTEIQVTALALRFRALEMADVAVVVPDNTPIHRREWSGYRIGHGAASEKVSSRLTVALSSC
jgi:hypothetical protein